MEKVLYTPIVKWKQGEQNALKELDGEIADKIIPLIEITPDINQDKFEASLSVWKNRYYYFDVLPECYDEFGGDIYFRLLNQCDSEYVIPVVNISDSDDVIESCVELSSNGFAIRVFSSDIDEVGNRLEELHEIYDSENVDIIVDLKEIDEENYSEKKIAFRALIGEMEYLSDYRRVILSSSAFPVSLSGVEKYSIALRPRLEFDLWNELKGFCKKKKSDLIFSDYCINNPSFFEYIPGMSPSYNIRYTDDQNFVLLRGDAIKKGGLNAENVLRLCRILTQSTHFSGKDFSWGDYYIASRDEDSASFGNLTTWRKVGTNHHITFVVNQLANLLDA